MYKNYINIKKIKLAASILLISIMHNSYAQETQETDIILDLRENVESLLFKSIVIPSTDSLVSPKAMQSLIAFREEESIRVSEDLNLETEGKEDTGQAKRIEYDGSRPNECVISLNTYASSFNDTSDRNIFIKMKWNETLIKEFIFLHELGHCQDGQIEPSNINQVQWREALADGYAMATLLDSNLVNEKSIDIFKNYRDKINSTGSVLMLNQIIPFFENEIKGKNYTPIERMNKIKQLRNMIYHVNTK